MIHQTFNVINLYDSGPMQIGIHSKLFVVSEFTYIQGMCTVHGVAPQIIIVSCRLTDNMAQGIHLQRTQQKVKPIKFLYQEYRKYQNHICFVLTYINHSGLNSEGIKNYGLKKMEAKQKQRTNKVNSLFQSNEMQIWMLAFLKIMSKISYLPISLLLLYTGSRQLNVKTYKFYEPAIK